MDTPHNLPQTRTRWSPSCFDNREHNIPLELFTCFFTQKHTKKGWKTPEKNKTLPGKMNKKHKNI